MEPELSIGVEALSGAGADVAQLGAIGAPAAAGADGAVIVVAAHVALVLTALLGVVALNVRLGVADFAVLLAIVASAAAAVTAEREVPKRADAEGTGLGGLTRGAGATSTSATRSGLCRARSRAGVAEV